MKISKREAQTAKDSARREKQQIMANANKHLSTKEKARIASLNQVIKAADKIIDS